MAIPLLCLGTNGPIDPRGVPEQEVAQLRFKLVLGDLPSLNILLQLAKQLFYLLRFHRFSSSPQPPGSPQREATAVAETLVGVNRITTPLAEQRSADEFRATSSAEQVL
jgi:hypothetical protein